MSHDVIGLTSVRLTHSLTLIMYKIKHNHGERHSSCFFSRFLPYGVILPQISFITFSSFDPQKQPCGDSGIHKKPLRLPEDIFPLSVRTQATDSSSARAFNGSCGWTIKVGARGLSYKATEGQSPTILNTQPAKHTSHICS